MIKLNNVISRDVRKYIAKLVCKQDCLTVQRDACERRLLCNNSAAEHLERVQTKNIEPFGVNNGDYVLVGWIQSGSKDGCTELYRS